MSTDDIGNRGQSIFFLLMTELCDGRDAPYFRPRFLGDKYPTFDYLVQVVGHEAYFFFVQVKTTTRGYTGTMEPRLLVQLSQQDVDSMVASPVPAYVVGIDEPGQVGYILSVNEARDHVASLCTKYVLNCENLKILWQEVHDYWSTRNMILRGSRFTE